MSWSRSEKIWYRCGHLISTALTSIFLRPKIVGRKNIPKTGAVVIAPNHRSNLDIPVLGCATFRPLRFMAKKDLFKNKVVAWYFETNGSFSVDRDNGDPAAIKRAVNYLKKGSAVVIFPEGGRKKSETVEELTAGVGFVAVKAQCPVLPVAITGLDNPIKKGLLPRFSRAKVLIGDPITIHLETDGKSSVKTAVLQERLLQDLRTLYQEVQKL